MFGEASKCTESWNKSNEVHSTLFFLCTEFFLNDNELSEKRILQTSNIIFLAGPLSLSAKSLREILLRDFNFHIWGHLSSIYFFKTWKITLSLSDVFILSVIESLFSPKVAVRENHHWFSQSNCKLKWTGRL